MRFYIRHATSFDFAKAVKLGPHVFHLYPRCDTSIRLNRFDLTVDPRPCAQWGALDSEGNTLIHAVFDSPVKRLFVQSVMEVETYRESPFDFIFPPKRDKMPLSYPPFEDALLSPARFGSAIPVGVRQISDKLLDVAGANPMSFLLEACNWVYSNITYEERQSGPVQSSTETLEKQGGACRDLSILFIDLCRAQELPARFVSGYHLNAPPDREHDLHAWAEVYLPGGGWRGIDPTVGQAVTSAHVPLASSYNPESVHPVKGQYPKGVRFTSSSTVKVERIG